MRDLTILLLVILLGCGSHRASLQSHAAIRRVAAPILGCPTSEVVIEQVRASLVTAKCRSMEALLMWQPEDHRWDVMSTKSTLCGGTDEEEFFDPARLSRDDKSDDAPIRFPVRD
jgi:hypothetical protein